MKKRTLQKMLSGILCGAALFGSSCLPAFAASGTTTITVNGDTNAWKAYRLLNVTSSLKANCGHGSSGHVNSCYIHYYNINSKYGTALRNAAADARLNFDENGDGTVSDNELLVGLQNMGASTTRLFSEKLYPKIAGITAEHTASNKAFSNVPYGYYLLTENGSAAGTTLMMVDAVGVDSITADTKAGVTTVTKKIVDGSKRVDAIDIKKGDTVNYEVTVTLPENLSERRSFVCDIHNTGTGAIKAESLKLFVDGREAVLSDTGSRAGEAKPSDGNYTFVETITQDEKWHCNCGVVIPYEQCDEHVLQHLLAGQPDNGFGEKMSNLKYVSDNQPILLEADDVITLKYAVTYTDSLTTKSSGNASESWASFTTDGEGTQRAETPHDKVTALTYQFVADKVDANGDALSGADFTLERKDGNAWTAVAYTETAGADANTSFHFTGLDAGTYRLTETKAPSGCTAIEPVTFTITATFDEVSDNPMLSRLSVSGNGAEGMFSVDAPNGTVSARVVNVRSGMDVTLPSTGEIVSVLLYLMGGGILFTGVLILLFGGRKKRP